MHSEETTLAQGVAVWIERRISDIRPMPWMIPAIVWFAVVSWRPLVVGFYHDDWVVLRPLLFEDGIKLFIDQASRPIYALLITLVRVVLPMDPFYYQCLLAFLLALSAFAIGVFAKTLSHVICNDERASSWSGALAASTWLAIPWNLALSVWPTTFPFQVSVIGFSIVGTVVLGSNSIKSKLAKALPVFFLTSLISEVFWLSFLPLLFMLFVFGNGFTGWRRYKEIIVLLMGFLAIQSVLVIYNRLFVYFGVGTNRSFNASFVDTAWLSLGLIINEISKSILYPIVFLSLIVSISFIIAYAAIFKNKRRAVLGVVGGVVFGSLISVLFYALAGYRIESIGIFSRTTAAISVWICLVPALLCSVVEKTSVCSRWVANGIVLFLVLFLSLSSINNLQAWIRSWQFQQSLLATFPSLELSKIAAKDSFVIIDADKPENSSEGLEAFWDVTSALNITKPEMKESFFSKRYRQFAVMANRGKILTTWDGSEIVQSWCHAPKVPLWKLDAPSQVYLWSYSSRQLTRLNNPAELGCEK